jgi:hypothetical protein
MTLLEKITALDTPQNRAAYAAAQDKALLAQDLLEGADIMTSPDSLRVRCLEHLLSGKNIDDF